MAKHHLVPAARPRKVSARVGAALAGLASTAALVAFAAPSDAAKPTGGGGGTSSLSVVVLTGTDTVPNWGETITYNVSSTVTSNKWVVTTCYVNGVNVYQDSEGFFPAYPWAPNSTLRSSSWMSGAADCTGVLQTTTNNGKTWTKLAQISFHVDA
jgi:hypothetical protein